MIAPSDKGCARRRTQGWGRKIRKSEPISSQFIQGRRRDYASERAGRAEAAVIGHDQKYVWCALGWHYMWCPPGFGPRSVFFNYASDGRLRLRNLLAIDSCCCAGRTSHACCLLGIRCWRTEKKDND